MDLVLRYPSFAKTSLERLCAMKQSRLLVWGEKPKKRPSQIVLPVSLISLSKAASEDTSTAILNQGSRRCLKLKAKLSKEINDKKFLIQFSSPPSFLYSSDSLLASFAFRAISST